MKEHPILFSGPMVRAILEGRKTQTRRVIKPQPTGSSTWLPHYDGIHHAGFYPNNFDARPARLGFPYGKPGDRLWVRETWAMVSVPDGTTARKSLTVFRADNPQGLEQPEKWKPSIHMPRRASRITLEVVDVRVERVQDISDEDCFAEGACRWYKDEDYGVMCDWTEGKRSNPYWTPQYIFKRLWESLNAKRGYGWESNPWVWVIEFKVMETT